jgi:hypothetical protein
MSLFCDAVGRFMCDSLISGKLGKEDEERKGWLPVCRQQSLLYPVKKVGSSGFSHTESRYVDVLFDITIIHVSEDLLLFRVRGR